MRRDRELVGWMPGWERSGSGTCGSAAACVGPSAVRSLGDLMRLGVKLERLA
jgi:hypothetical protein